MNPFNCAVDTLAGKGVSSAPIWQWVILHSRNVVGAVRLVNLGKVFESGKSRSRTLRILVVDHDVCAL